MQIYHDKLRIKADIVRKLFKSTIDNILSLINEILSNNSTAGVSHILMVGGFSECQLVYDAMDKKFPAKRIIIPKEAGLSVMKGAVLFGHRPDFVQSRIMRFSYGVKTNVPFDERKYDVKHLKEMEGEERCDNVFSMIVEKDQQVEAGTIVKGHISLLIGIKRIWIL